MGLFSTLFGKKNNNEGIEDTLDCKFSNTCELNANMPTATSAEQEPVIEVHEEKTISTEIKRKKYFSYELNDERYFFGLDMKNSPNEDWGYISKRPQFDCLAIQFEYNLPLKGFESVTANVVYRNDEVYSNYFLEFKYDYDKLVDIFYYLEKLYGDSELTRDVIEVIYLDYLLEDSTEYKIWEKEGLKTVTVERDYDTGNVKLSTTCYDFNLEYTKKYGVKDEILEQIKEAVIGEEEVMTPEISRWTLTLPYAGDVSSYYINYLLSSSRGEDSQPIRLINGNDKQVEVYDESNNMLFSFSSPIISAKLAGSLGIGLIPLMKPDDDNTILTTTILLSIQNIAVESTENSEQISDELSSLGHVNLRDTKTAVWITYTDSTGKRQRASIYRGNVQAAVLGQSKRPDYDKFNGKIQENDIIKVIPEPENEFDPNAIAVYWNDYHIGYIPRRQVPIVALCIDKTGTEGIVSYVDEEEVGIMLKPTLQNLGDELLEEEFGPYGAVVKLVEKNELYTAEKEVNCSIERFKEIFYFE